MNMDTEGTDPEIRANKAQVFLWSRKSAASLFINDPNSKTPRLHEHLAYPGSSCNSHELAALHAVMDAHEEYYTSNKKIQISSVKKISQKCRGAAQKCLQEWDQELLGKDSAADSDKDERISLALLNEVCGYVHLSEVVIPLLMSPDAFETPGAATASLVRYLRKHVLGDVVNAASDAELDQMMESTQPEEFGDGTLYWSYVYGLVARGCLEEAWGILSSHSVYVQSLDPPESLATEPYWISLLSKVRESFGIVRELFMRAPLPGGSSSKFDAELYDSQFEVEELDISEETLEGLNLGGADYKYWEQENTSTAIFKFKHWQEYAKQCRITMKQQLGKVVPQIDILMGIICGQTYTPPASSFEPWAEKLCAELLYFRPDWRPRDLAPRTKRILETFPSSGAGHFLALLEGNIGRVVEIMYVAGGSSGAALPATLMAILFNIYSIAGLVDGNVDDRKSEFLTEAASAIVASLADQHSGAATSLALRLLVPVTIDEENILITGAVVNVIEGSLPSSDAEVTEIINICKPLVDRVSVATLDACSSLILARSEQCRYEKRYKDSMLWLNTGVELEEILITTPSLGLCYRAAVKCCYKMVSALIQILDGDESFTEDEIIALVREARELAGAFEPIMAGPMSIPEAQLLVLTVNLFDTLEIGEPDYEKAAALIAQSFEMSSSEDWPVCHLLPPSLRWKMIQCAQKQVIGRRPLGDPSSFPIPTITNMMHCVDILTDVSEVQKQEARKVFEEELVAACVEENSTLQDRPNAVRQYAAAKEELAAIKTPDLSSHLLRTQQQVIQRTLGDMSMYV